MFSYEKHLVVALLVAAIIVAVIVAFGIFGLPT